MTNRIVLANLGHRRMRTVLAVLAIGMEVAMILLMLGLADGLVGESTRRQKGVGADILIRPATSSSALSAGSAGLDAALLQDLGDLPGVTVAMGTAFSMQGGLLTVTGVDLEKFRLMSGELQFLEGGPFERPDDAIVDDVYAKQKGLSTGGPVRLLNRDFRVAGVIASGKLSRVFIPLATMQEVMGWEGKLSQIYLKLADPTAAPEFVNRVKQMLPDHPVYTMEEFMSLFTAQTRGRGDDFVTVIVGIAMVVGFIVVLMSMYTAVLDRTRDIGILKALGASPGYIVDIFLRESLTLTLTGIATGVALSYLAVAFVEDRFPLVTLVILREHLMWAVIISIIASLLGSLYPALKAARHDAIEALAYE